jgi:NAD(P)H dehydrogenase (quinone)
MTAAAMRIGVTGATGGVGGAAVRSLVDRRDVRVVAIGRNPEVLGLAPHPRIEPNRADYDDPVSLETAFSGLDALLYISSDGRAESMLRHHRNVARGEGHRPAAAGVA